MELNCEALTNKGTRCTRIGKNFSAISQRNLCKQHYDKDQRDFIDDAAKREAEQCSVEEKQVKQDQRPTVAAFSQKITDKLSTSQLRKLEQHLLSEPKASDSAGCIYIYSMSNEQGMNYWKVGTTKKEGDARLKEWDKLHKARILKRAVFKVEKNHNYIEKAIHLMLAYARMRRMPVKDENVMLSQWYHGSKAYIEDKNFDYLMAKYETFEAMLAQREKKHHKEWFAAPIEEVEDVCKCAIEYFGKNNKMKLVN